MSDIVPRYHAARNTRKELEALRQAEIVAHAAREVEARAKGDIERLRLAQAEFRVHGVYELATYATSRATGLDRIITAQSASNPHLEAIHRSFEETAAVVTGIIIYNYGTSK
jgi:hypothetical protein